MEALQFPALRFKKNTAIHQLPIHKIRPNPYLPRKYFNQYTLEALADSIRIYGVLQPILVRRMHGGFYELIAGARRLRGAEMAGLLTIPAIVLPVGEAESAILAYVENIQRDGLSCLEEAESYGTMMEDYRMTEGEIAACISCTEGYVAERLRLIRLEKPLQKCFVEEGLSLGHAKALLRLPDTYSRRLVLEQVITDGLDAKQTEQLVAQTMEHIRYGPRKKNRQKEKRLIQDFRLYTNTLRQSVALLKHAGAKVTYRETDGEEVYEMVISIAKKQTEKEKNLWAIPTGTDCEKTLELK